MSDNEQPSREVIDYFLDTHISGIEELQKAFPAVTLQAVTQDVIRMETRRKAVRRAKRRLLRQKRATR